MAKRGKPESSGPIGNWLEGLRLIIVQDGKNMASLRSSKIKEAASKGGADVVLVEYQPAKASAAKKQVERAGGQFTHLVTELADPSAVLADLGLKPPSEGGPQPIRPLWVSKCTTAKSRVPEEEFMDFTKVEALPAPKGVPAKDDSGRPAKKARGDNGPPYEVLPLSVLDDYTGLEPGVREALLAYNDGELRKYHPKHFPKYACMRPSPLHHPNQALAKVFEELVQLYDAVGDDGREISFARALSVIRAWPTRITRSSELRDVPRVGKSSLEIVTEFLESGKCERLQKLKDNKDNMALLNLCRVHGVGCKMALKWYQAGYRSVDQIIEELKNEQASGEDCRFRQVCSPSREHLYGLQHFYEVNEKIPRDCVARLGELVRQAAVRWLEKQGLPVEKLLSTICGSYIRGKAFSGDLDIIMTVADDQDTSRGLREGVKEALVEMGVDLIVLKDAAEGGFHTQTTTQHEKVESHQNVLTMIKFEGKYRRVDIITSPFKQYAFAILGWAGNKQLEKDLRDHANTRGLHLSQQAVYDLDTGMLKPNPKDPEGVFRTEKDIFEFLGLKYLPHCLRWA